MRASGVGDTAILVLPTTTDDQLGPVAGWISTSGWAAAAERVLGTAFIVTRHGLLDVAEVRRRAATLERAATGERRGRRAVPVLAKTLIKDVREATRARRFHVDPAGPWASGPGRVAFVWQRHELFHSAGLRLADELAVPSVLFVPALTVWQAEQWGVRRPGWGRRLERRGELRVLEQATVVACGSPLIAEQVARVGIPEDRLLVTPTGVDLALFGEPTDRGGDRARLGLADQVVIGWVGSFRPFHALDDLVRAAATAGDVTLLFVGDGPERSRVEALATSLGVRARFTGVVPHHELPRLLSTMDVAVVLARADQPFHYSPLKVAEYLAAGLPVVAPAVRQLTERLGDDQDAVFFEPGDVAGLASILSALAGDPVRRDRLGSAARRAAAEWSWDRQVERVVAKLAAPDA